MKNGQSSHSFMPPDFPCYGESKYVKLRELKFHYLEWGNEEQPLIIFLHGFMDHAHTFDLLASKLSELNKYRMVAWDARGFGETDWVHPSGYYHFFEYIYDLDLFINHFQTEKVILVGHSMGGIIASIYAGAFPERVEKIVNMEGWLLPETKFSDAPGRLRRWIDEVKNLEDFKPLQDLKDAVKRLQKNDPLMSEDVASHLAYEGIREKTDGLLYWKHDPLHKTRSPQQAYIPQIEAFWNSIQCPALLLKGEKSDTPYITADEEKERIKSFKNSTYSEVKDAGHNLHFHQPESIANMIDDFLKI